MIHNLQASQSRAVRSCSDLCIIAILVWNATPEMWTKPVTVWSAPLHFAITQGLWLLLVVEKLGRKVPPSKFFWLLLAAIGYTAARAGFANDRNNWDLKYFVIDLWTVQTFVLGFLWSRRRSLTELAKVFQITSGIVIPLVLITTIGLYFGVIKPIDNEYSDRLYTSSLWSAGCVAQFMWPILCACRSAPNEWSRLRTLMAAGYLQACGRFLVSATLFIAMFTATRSLLVVSVVTCAAIWLMEPRRTSQQRVVAVVVQISFVGAGLTLASVTKVKGYSVIDRFQGADLTGEVRINELQWLFEQLGDDFLSGWGFGSVFYSSIRYHNRQFEAAPHIGIVTPLLKGGLVLTTALIFVPIAMCLAALWRRSPEARAAAGCVLVYLVTASLSGGWYPYQTLMFGVGVGMASIRRLSRSEFSQVVGIPMRLSPTTAALAPFGNKD